MLGQKLVCMDFDQTLVKGHFHSFLQKTKKQPPNENTAGVQILQNDGTFLRKDPQCKSWVKVSCVAGKGAKFEQMIEFLVDPNKGPKNPNEMAQTIKAIIDNGHKLAIVSFTLYPEVIIPSLHTILNSLIKDDERTQSYLAQIAVIGGFPSDGDPDNSPLGKEEHIFAAMESYGIRNLENVLLVDDSKKNLDKAVSRTKMRAENMVLVPASKEADHNSYIPKIVNFIEENLNEVERKMLERPPSPVIPKYTQEVLSARSSESVVDSREKSFSP